ncbi:docking protein 3-like [Erpetoichthys calabaricus]|uniref:docking protein 3-like n=1 Tax=Erpetoichthys calabaricus TaxID=27687 RepID=UPI0022340F1D|nr:docking protein 3-like [Erpetoichthys calabaricus]
MEKAVMEGVSHTQVVRFGKKFWKKAWLILYPGSSYGIGRIEFFEVRDKVEKLDSQVSPSTKQTRKGEKKLIRLVDCVSISGAPCEVCPKDTTAFYVNTTQRTYVFASSSAQEWIDTLCQLAFQGNEQKMLDKSNEEMKMEENALYLPWKQTHEFLVTIVKTDAAERCQLAGDYILLSNQVAIVLVEPQSKQALYTWPYHLLRRYGQDKANFSFEAGRRCESGEGHFVFFSSEVQTIFRCVEYAIAQQEKQRRSLTEVTLDNDFNCVFEESQATASVTQMKDCNTRAMSYSSIEESIVSSDKETAAHTPPMTMSKTYPVPLPPDKSQKNVSAQRSSLDRGSESSLYTTVNEPVASPRRKESVAAREPDTVISVYQNVNESLNQNSHPRSPVVTSRKKTKELSLYDYEDFEKANGTQSSKKEMCYSTIKAVNKRGDEDVPEDSDYSDNAPRSTIITKTVIPSDFKQRLSNLISKEAPKGFVSVAPRDQSCLE